MSDKTEKMREEFWLAPMTLHEHQSAWRTCPKIENLDKASMFDRIESVINARDKQWQAAIASQVPMLGDTERLDWLQKNEHSVYAVTQRKSRQTTLSQIEYYMEFLGWSVDIMEDRFPTMREAIDAAIAKETKP